MEPITRKEQILNAILTGDTSDLPEPLTREEAYLEAIALNGGGGGGADNYNALSNKPKINNVELKGNKTSADLGLQSMLTFDNVPVENSSRPVKSGGVYTALKGKMDSYWVTPQMFGAVGDGTTDDTQAINDAIQSALQNSGIVYFPSGEYLVQWSGLNVYVTSDLTLFGDGKNDSVIRIATEYTESNSQGIMFINGDSTKASNLTLRNIGIVYDDNDDTITLPNDERRTVQITGIYKSINIDGVYIHLGGSATTLPSNDLIWLQCGADIITVKDCLLENFSNRETGGCLWVTPIDGDATTVRTIKYLRILNNEIRNTNRDEGIGIWQRSNDTDFNCRNVVIDGNKIIHDNWNGECYPNNNLITGYAKSGAVIDVNYVITNNLFETHKMNSQPVRFSGLNGITFEGNEVVVTDKSGASSATNNIFVVEGGGKVTVKSNVFNHQPTTSQCEFRVTNNDVDFYDNIINSRGSVYFRNNSWSTSDAHTFNVVGNIVNVSSQSAQLVIRKNASLGNMIFADNVVNAGLTFNNVPVGSGLEFKNNKFNNGKPKTITSVKGDSLVFAYNDGVVLDVDNANISSPMNHFAYVGRKEDLTFKVNGAVVSDSDATRAIFFASCDIAYVDSTQIQALTNYVLENNVKNICPFDMAYIKSANTSSWNGNTYTQNNASFVYDNGTVTASGVPSAVTSPRYALLSLPAGDYILSGCPANGSNTTYALWVGVRNASDTDWIANYKDYGNGVAFTVPVDASYVRIETELRTGFDGSTKVFKPMIRLASITDPTYASYAKPNWELTADVATLNDVTVTDVSSSFTDITSGTITMIKCGKIRQLQFDNVAFPSDASFPTLDAADRPKAVSFGSLTVTSDNTSGRIWLRVNGTFGTGNVLGKTVMGALTWIAS